MTPSRPQFHKQETLYSCVPACLRMVLGSFGADISEGELRRLADCTPFGTDALMAVEAARALGFTGTSKHTLSLNELKALVADGYSPIVFVDLNPIDGIDDIHAMVVVELDDQAIIVLDPLQGSATSPFTSSQSRGRGGIISPSLFRVKLAAQLKRE